MKQYIAENQLRLVGKGWEIRHQLRRLAESSKAPGLIGQWTSGMSGTLVRKQKQQLQLHK